MTTADPRVAAYLDDVARMLGSIDPIDRVEILAGLREHIDAALDVRATDGEGMQEPASDDAVRQVLAELGPPERIAAAALSGLDPAPQQYSVQAAQPTGTRPSLTQPWVPVTVGLLMSLSVALYLLVLGVTVALAVAEESVSVPSQALAGPSGAGFHGPAPAEVTQNPMLPASYDIVWTMLAPLPLVGLPWVVSTALLASSALWKTVQKWVGALLLPAVALTCGVLAWLATLVPPSATRSVVLVAAAVAVAAAAASLVARLWRDGARRAREWERSPVAA